MKNFLLSSFFFLFLVSCVNAQEKKKWIKVSGPADTRKEGGLKFIAHIELDGKKLYISIQNLIN